MHSHIEPAGGAQVELKLVARPIAQASPNGLEE
jgi:hypothetical protein